jgi:hypothetical protein
MIDWSLILLTLGSTSIVVAAIAWLGKAVVGQYLSRNLETHKAKLDLTTETQLKSLEASLKRKADERLAEIDRATKESLQRQQHEFSLQQQAAEARSAADAARIERARQEIERWANPILGAVRELCSRLDNILRDTGYAALSQTAGLQTDPDWSIDYDYFMRSTVFLFCQYFCWERLLHEKLTFDLFRQGADKDRFLARLRDVRTPLSQWPLEEEPDAPPGDDSQLFSLQQRALGEMLIEEREAGAGCMRAADFFARWSDAAFRARFAALERLLRDVSPGGFRWERLERTLTALSALEQECMAVLTPTAENAITEPIP